MSDTFKIGDLVWAKMKGFPPWPGRVSDPPKDSKRTPKKGTSQWIFFFGSKNFGWIENSNIKPYLQFKESLSKANKTQAFIGACAAIEEYIAKGDNSIEPSDETSTEEAFDNLVKSATPKPKKPKKSDTPKSESPKIDTPKADTSKSEDKTTQEETKPKVVKSAEKKRVKRAVTPSLNGDSPAKKKKQNIDEISRSLIEQKESIVTLYKNSDLDKEPSTPGLSLNQVPPKINRVYSETDLPTSTLKFGFLGLGIMGSGIVNNLLDSGHRVMVWNRHKDKTDDFASKGADVGESPSDIVYASDITFCCVSDPNAAKEVIFGPDGVLSAMDATKGYIELTTIDNDTALDIADAVRSKGGRFLEAQLQGSKTEAEEGKLVVLCSGDQSLYDDAHSCFKAMGICSFFLGETGNAAKMNLVIQLITGVTLGALAEGMALADSAGLRQSDLVEVMSYTPMTSQLVLSKAKQITDCTFNTNMPLGNMQKDLTLSLALGDNLEHPLPLTAAANEIYKHARKLGYSEQDASAVYIRAKF